MTQIYSAIMLIVNTLCFVSLHFASYNNFILGLDCYTSVEVSECCVNTNNRSLEKQTSHPEVAVLHANLGLDLLNFTASGLELGNYFDNRMSKNDDNKSPAGSLMHFFP